MQPAKELALSPAEGPGGANLGRASAWFDVLFREHYPRVVALLARLTGDRGVAEEIGSDVFCKLSNRGPEGDVLPWLYRVAINAGFDGIRVNVRRRRREQEAHAESIRSAASGGALEDLLREERRTRVQATLAELKPRDAQLLLLRADGLAYRELADTLGVQPGSIGTMLARAEAEFEKKFRARYGDEL